MKFKIAIIGSVAFVFLILSGTSLYAQNKVSLVSGKILDEYGRPLPGSRVRTQKSGTRAEAQPDGSYSIFVNDGSKFLIYSGIGYAGAEVGVPITGDSLVNVTLKPDMTHSDDIIELGYSRQRRGDISGAVSASTGAELWRTPVANLSTSFAGRFSGLITQETSSELSRAATNFYVRGVSSSSMSGPLVIIDGITYDYKSNQSLEYISPAEIESVTVLKDASTQALYGTQGANGVIVVTTKRGAPGPLKVSVRLDESLQEMTTRPAFISSAEYTTLRNQAAYNDGHGLNYYFTDQQIQNFKAGTNPLYPNNNWYDRYFRKLAQMQRVNVDLQGGNDRVHYFSNVNVMRQGDQINTDQTAYNAHLIFTWINFRSNVEMKINNMISSYLHLSGNIKREAVPGSGLATSDIYSSVFYAPPTMYGPLTPGGQVVTTVLDGSPTYGLINRDGYTRHTVTNINAQYGLNLDLKFLVPGLQAHGIVAYQTNTVNSLYTTNTYTSWTRTGSLDTLLFVQKGSVQNTNLSYTKASAFYYHLTYQGMLDYQKDFGLSKVTGMAYVFFKNLSENSGSGNSAFPYNRLQSGFEGAYSYDQKYLFKYDMGLSGSDFYARAHRYALLPAASVAWVVSRESFMRQASWISHLKLRASYGKAGDDAAAAGRYGYLDNYTFAAGGTVSYLKYLVTQGKTGNPDLSPEIVKKQNYGIDLQLFNQLSLSLDLFWENRDNVIINNTSSVPTYQGVALGNYPSTNSGKFTNHGYEISLQYEKIIDKDWKARVGGFVDYAKNKNVYAGETKKAADYAYRNWTEGFPAGQAWGYLVDRSNGGNGFFNSAADIASSGLTYSMGTPRVGDLKYKDLNKDGVIDQRDEAPIGNGSLPLYYFGFSGGATYKAFNLSVLFQGVGNYSSIYSGAGVYETSYDGIYGSLHENAWTQERYNNKEKITAPALSVSQSVSQQSNDYYKYNRSYLRLKNVELSYTIPTNAAKKIGASCARILLSGQNLITWDKMKSKDFGPEGSGYLAIPVYRVYNVGLSIQF